MTDIKFEDKDGDIHHLPSKKAVCPNCEGHGTHLTTSIREHGYSMEEFNESFDEEEQGEYFKRGGIYDVTCEECKGLRVVDVVDTDALTEEDKEIYKQYQESEEESYRYDAICAAERRMGA